MGGGLNHLSLLLEFTLINQNNRNTLSLAHGVWTTDVKSTIKLAPDKTLDFYYTVITSDLYQRIVPFCGYCTFVIGPCKS